MDTNGFQQILGLILMDAHGFNIPLLFQKINLFLTGILFARLIWDFLSSRIETRFPGWMAACG
jgi:hypothetical protein